MLAAVASPAPQRIQPRSSSRRAGADHGAATAHERLDHVSRAYRELRSLIVWGQLPPGARIAERAVADRLGLSRTPVRSALHRLQQEGLISSVGRGREQRLIVAPLTQDDAREVFFIVGHLEGLAARTAALLPPARRREIVRRLRERVGDMEIVLEPVERIPRTASGKVRVVINKLEAGAAASTILAF
jgi:DNA-binding GntR family transcriptional regulator